MERGATAQNGYGDLVAVVRQVRRRWRMKRVLQGLAIVGGALLVTVLLAVLTLERSALDPAALALARLFIVITAVGVAVRSLVPVWRSVSDEQVALYLEEHEPSLRAALITALTAGSGEGEGGRTSPAFARRTIETALERCREIEYGRRIERRNLSTSVSLIGGTAAVAVVLYLIAPPGFQRAARSLILPFQPAEAAAPSLLVVEPGNTSLPRGADLPVTAVLSGFHSREVDLVTRGADDSTFLRLPMVARENGEGFELRLFNLDRDLDYYVEADGVRSPVFRATLLDLPYVQRLEVELEFPEYTGLPSRRYQEGGDIAAPAGTTVRIRAIPTMPVASGQLRLSDGRSVELRPDSAGSLAGDFRVTATGLYQIALQQTGADELVPGSPEYLVEVIDDAAPRVSFAKPGRDVNVTSIDEVFIEAQAEDDYGIRTLDLYFSVNGGPEQTVRLFGARPLPEVSAGHTFYMEEYGLQPGDFISYYARAEDVGPGTRRPATTDIYFVEIRPFGRAYRQADEQGQQQGNQPGGGQEEDGQLSRRQRELIAATFNVVRDRREYSAQEYREHVSTLAEAQESLREQAESVTRRLAVRGEARDSSFERIMTMLPRASSEMRIAAERLGAGEAEEALPAEQRALMYLQRAEAAIREVQVSMGGQQEGGGGGGQRGGPTPEDLADLMALEASRMRNQYETVQRGERQQSQAAADETLDRVRDLARRLQSENERLREAMANQQLRDGSGAANQRRMAEEAEAQARRLERLARDQSRPDLLDPARRLQEAADALRRAAAEGRSGSSAEASSALAGIEEARRRLERNRTSSQRDAAEEINRRARRLAEEQREISREMDELRSAGPDRMDRTRRLLDRKDEQASRVAEIQRDLDRLSNETRADQPDASRRLQAAAESIRRNQLQERIRASRAAAQPNAPEEYRRYVESEITSGLDQLRNLTEQATASFTEPAGDRGRDGLDRARNLVRGLESMQERTRQAAAERGSPGQETPDERRRLQRDQDPGGDPGQGATGENEGGQAVGEGGQEEGRGEGAPAGRGLADAPGGVRGGGGSGARPALQPGEVRQFRGEVRARIEEARQLRQQLAREGMDVRELDAAIEELRQLDDDRRYADLDELQHIQRSLLDRLKGFEFTLRLHVRGEEARRLFLSGTGGVPPEFQELVEQYYRELSERPRR
jgi:hypothetical protein